MIKRILKMFGICMALLVILGGIGVGIYALTGGFNRVIIDITKLYIDDEAKADKEIYTLSDITTMINCAPFNATSKKLEVIVSDPLRVVDKDGVLIKEGVLKNIPKTVNAGEEFTLEVNKDSMGNNIGGVATLTFRPADKDKVVTDFTLKVVVDVAIPNNSLYFAGNDGDVLTTTGKSITMGLSAQKQNIYLKSNLVNAFCLETSKGNLKQAEISYVYKNQKGEVVEKDTFKDLKYKRSYDEVAKEYNYYYEVPFTPKTPGTISVTARMHRTNEIEQAYNTGLNGESFDNIPDFVINSTEINDILMKYNDFLKDYMSFFDDSEESYNFFKGKMKTDGTPNLTTKQDIEESKKYVFQTCTTTITVTAVNLTGITSIKAPKVYDVFDNKTLYLVDSEVPNNNMPSIIKEFGLQVTLSENEVANLAAEQKNLFTSLKIRPYVYVSKAEYEKNKDTLWVDYKTIFGVGGFDEEEKPINVEPLTFDNVKDYPGAGFLLLLERNDNDYKDYIDIEESSDISNKSWSFDFNVPMGDDSQTISGSPKALFLEFEVTGRDLQKNQTIIRNTYSRIYINYENYSFKEGSGKQRLSLINNDPGTESDKDLKKMSINKKVNNVNSSEYSEILYKQYITTDFSDVENYNQLQYKSVMYFVEESSNDENGFKKVASIGRYNFKMMNSEGSNDLVRIAGSDILIGQRLPNEGTKEDPKYNIYAINASKDPVKVFSVVYLSDKEGNPIDINGRKIDIKEDILGDPTTLVVLSITLDINDSTTMQTVYIDSFVENINYYTENKVAGAGVSETIIVNGDPVIVNYNAHIGLVKRNNIKSYRDEDGNEFTDKGLKQLQDFLTLKLLYNNKFELIVTNFELGSDGDIEDRIGEVVLDIVDFKGITRTQGFQVDTQGNKQIALNNMCSNEYEFNENFELFVAATNEGAVQGHAEILKELDNVIGIKYVIKAQGKRDGAQDIYFRESANSSAPNAIEYSDYMVGWKVSEIKTSQVDIENTDNHYFDDYEKLYARYDSDASNGYKQEFGTVTLSPTIGQGLEFKKYYFMEREDNSNPINTENDIDKFNFKVTDNLVIDDANGVILNSDIIDMSQSVFKNESANPEEYDHNSGEFPDISTYRDYYLKNSNRVTITCDNTNAIYQLESDLVFDKIEENKLIINDKKYDIKNDGNGDYIIINNQEYQLMGNELRLNAGKFIPVINDNTVLILGQEFTIYTLEGLKYIYAVTKDGVGIGMPTQIVKSNIEQSNYFEKTNDSSMWLKDDVEGKDKLYINFKKGGVLTKDGAPVYVKDQNGKYRINSNGDYVVCEPSFTGDRYSKKGIPVFLMISINFKKDEGSPEEIITKAIEFELIQEDINLVVTDNDGNTSVIPSTTDSSSTNAPKVSIDAGSESKISLQVGNPSSFKTISLVGASFEKTFFQYCTFKLEGANNKVTFKGKGSEILAGNQINELSLSAKDMYGWGANTGKLSITYPISETQSITRVISLNVNPNFKFSTKSSGSGDGQVGGDENYYIIKLNSTGSDGTDIQTLLKTYFKTDEGEPGVSNPTTMSLSVINDANNNGFARVNGSTLQIGTSYAVIDSNMNNQAIQDSFTCTITLHKAGKDDITVDKKLKVFINPTYTFDFRELDGIITIIPGQSLLNSTNYIKIYDNNNILIPSTLNLFTIKEGNNEYNNGIINNDISKWNEDQPKNLVLEYTEGLGGNAITRTVDFSVNVKGFEVYYSQDGEFGVSVDPDKYADVATGAEYTLPETISLQLDQNGKINLDKYFLAFTCENELVAINGSTTYDLVVGLAKDDSETPEFNEIDSEGTYSKIVIAKVVDGIYTEIIRINKLVTITQAD